MTATLKGRASVVAAALVLVLGLAAVLAASSMRDATAQTARVTWSFQFQDFVTVRNGFGGFSFDLSPVGPNPKMITAMCTGNRPSTGPNIPAQVVTNVTSIDGFTMRILSNVGRPLNATVGVNCAFLVETDDTPAAAPTSLQNKVTGAKVRVGAVKS